MNIDYNKRYTDKQLERMPILVAYDLICRGKYYCRFHNAFWRNRRKAKEDAKILVKHIIVDVLKCDLDKVPTLITKEHFIKLRLGSMIDFVFNGSVMDAILETFPNEYNKFQFRETFDSDFSIKECNECVRWLIKDKLKYNLEECIQNLTAEDFVNYNLTYMFVRVYKANVSRALLGAYSPEFSKNKGSLKELMNKYTKGV